MRREPVYNMGLVKCRRQRLTVQTGTKQRKLKGHDEPIEEPVMETFECVTPVGYDVDALRMKLAKECAPIIRGDRSRRELSLERFPQVGTVMGEINAQIPKAKRLKFGYTTDEDKNTLFVIERAK